MKETIKVLKALSDETRMRILNLLLQRECCVCEVMQAMGISQSKASRGLSALYDVGLLKLKREGPWSLYSIDRDDIENYQSKIIEAVEEALANNEITLLDKERLKKAKRSVRETQTSLKDGVSCDPASL
jgi:ArsR family transcriptional regulator